jgi:hypothetical protein
MLEARREQCEIEKCGEVAEMEEEMELKHREKDGRCGVPKSTRMEKLPCESKDGRT